jgi:hypothetical protein
MRMGCDVDLDADEVADQLWSNYGEPTTGNISGNSAAPRAKNTDGAFAEYAAEAPSSEGIATDIRKWTE